MPPVKKLPEPCLWNAYVGLLVQGRIVISIWMIVADSADAVEDEIYYILRETGYRIQVISVVKDVP